MTDLRIATRRSELALAQARWVADRLTLLHPGLRAELVEITTSGDLDRTSPVASLTEVGAFVRSVQQAVLEGAADVAVHSGKDLPVVGPDRLQGFHPEREAPWDVLCGSTLDDLAEGARVGTGSPRRAAQLKALRPDLRVDDIRGNVDTRLAKAATGEFDAVVLAEAGLARIGRRSEIAQRFQLAEMVPAPAQAALTVEALVGSEASRLLGAIDDAATRRTVTAEREVLARTGAGCRAALGVYGEQTEHGIRLTGFVQDDHGSRRAAVEGETPGEAADRLIAELAL